MLYMSLFQRSIIGLALFLALMAGGAYLAAQFSHAAPPLRFSLTDHHGRAVTEKDFTQGPLLVFFGFTGCSNICPLTLQRLAETQDDLRATQDTAKILFITTDPEHDTPAALARFLSAFRADATGLTGNRAQLQPLYDAFGVYSGRGAGTDHSGLVYVFDRGRLAGRFTAALKAPDAAQLVRGLSRRRRT